MVYVDETIFTFRSQMWCHLFSDQGEAELHPFAQKIGLKREWFQSNPRHPHYDLSPGKRAEAVKNGATEVTTEEMVRIIWRWRESAAAEG